MDQISKLVDEEVHEGEIVEKMDQEQTLASSGRRLLWIEIPENKHGYSLA